MPSKPKNFGWKRLKLTALTYEELEVLIADVKANHAEQNGIHLYDAAGRKKLDALTWAIYNKNKEDRKNADRRNSSNDN